MADRYGDANKAHFLKSNTHQAKFMTEVKGKGFYFDYIWGNKNKIDKEFIQTWIAELKKFNEVGMLHFDEFDYFNGRSYSPMGVAYVLQGVKASDIEKMYDPKDLPDAELKRLPVDLIRLEVTEMHCQLTKLNNLEDTISYLEAYTPR